MQGNELSLGTLDLDLDIVRLLHYRPNFIGFILRLLNKISDFPLFIGL